MSDKHDRSSREKKFKSDQIQENYYQILNLSPECSKDEIDNAYRSLALKWHPDKCKENKEEAEAKFREISKAYQILSNEDTRKTYDDHGVTAKTENLIDPYAIFKNLFEEEDNKIPDVIIKIDASMERLYRGFIENVNFKRFSPCKKCDCTGTRDKIDGSCTNCKGRGILLETVKGGKMGYMMNEKRCDVCRGKGLDPDIKLCKKCEGNKYVKEEIECEVEVPPGAYDNYFIKLENEGNYVPRDERKTKASRTNVIVVIKEIVAEDSKIKRGMFIKEINRVNRADLLLSVEITFGESIVGIKKEINYLGDKIGIEIDQVIQNGDIHVVKGKGMKLVPEELEKIKGDKTKLKSGDLFIVFKVEKPILNVQQQKRMWQIVTDTPYPEYDDVDNIVKTTDFNNYIQEHTKDKARGKNSSDTNTDTDTDSNTDSNVSDEKISTHDCSDISDDDQSDEQDDEHSDDPDENFDDLLDDNDKSSKDNRNKNRSKK